MTDPNRKCYISGKISGLTEKQYTDNFTQASELAANVGLVPVNPLDVIPTCGETCDSSETFDDGSYRHTWECYLKYDIKALMDCAFLYHMDNALDSRGARLEIDVARAVGIVVLDDFNTELYL